MKIVVDPRKSLEKNAEFYFEESKKAKRKLEGAKKAILLLEQKLSSLKPVAPVEKKVRRERKWFEKFHWFYSSEGFLCIGGRDAVTNEIVVKKYAKPDDILFHTDAPGSPFFLIIKEDKVPGKATIDEVAQATASYSRAWRRGLAGAEVFWVMGEQLSKTANPGEFIARGAFMVRGKRNFLTAQLRLAVGINEGVIVGGPVNSVSKSCEKFVEVVPGDMKKSDAAKKIRYLIGGEVDDIVAALPGDVKVISK